MDFTAEQQKILHNIARGNKLEFDFIIVQKNSSVKFVSKRDNKISFTLMCRSHTDIVVGGMDAFHFKIVASKGMDIISAKDSVIRWMQKTNKQLINQPFDKIKPASEIVESLSAGQNISPETKTIASNTASGSQSPVEINQIEIVVPRFDFTRKNISISIWSILFFLLVFVAGFLVGNTGKITIIENLVLGEWVAIASLAFALLIGTVALTKYFVENRRKL